MGFKRETRHKRVGDMTTAHKNMKNKKKLKKNDVSAQKMILDPARQVEELKTQRELDKAEIQSLQDKLLLPPTVGEQAKRTQINAAKVKQDLKEYIKTRQCPCKGNGHLAYFCPSKPEIVKIGGISQNVKNIIKSAFRALNDRTNHWKVRCKKGTMG